MKLRNKKTGEILGSLGSFIIQNPNHINCEPITKYNSLTELNEDWEDYEEPKTHWMIDTSILEPVREIAGEPYEVDKEIGNWFETKEEAEKAVEKLKVWKRLRDNGFKFVGWKNGKLEYPDYVSFDCEDYKGCAKDLDIIFGGGE